MSRIALLLLLIAVAFILLAAVAFMGQPSSSQCKAKAVTPVEARIYVDEEGCGVAVLKLIIEDKCSASVEAVGLGELEAKPLGVGKLAVTGPEAYLLVYYNPYTRKLIFTSIAVGEVEDRVRSMLSKGLCLPGIGVGLNYPGYIVVEGRSIYYTWVTVKAGQPG